MDFQDTITLVDTAMMTVAGRHLKDAEVAVLQGAWEGLTYEQMTTESEFTVNYLRGDIGPKLWKHLSRAFGEEVNKTNIRAVLARQSVTPPSPRHNLERIPEISEFYGRRKELNDLREWIVQQKSHVVTLYGISGIGKTSLAVKLVQEIQGEFEQVIWRSLSTAPPLPDLLTDILKIPAATEKSLGETENRIAQLIEYFQSHSCLLILDNWETILKPASTLGRYREGYESYSSLIGQVGEEIHNSCLVICSQEEPREVKNLVNRTPLVHSLKVEGFNVEESKDFLQNKGLTEQEQWKRFVENLNGHPFAIKLNSAIIEQFYNKDVALYVRKSPTYVELDLVFNELFQRLSETEKEILFYLAKQDQAVSMFQIQENLSTFLKDSEIIESLLSLQRRALIEQKNSQGNQHSAFLLPSLAKSYIVKNYIHSF